MLQLTAFKKALVGAFSVFVKHPEGSFPAILRITVATGSGSGKPPSIVGI